MHRISDGKINKLLAAARASSRRDYTLLLLIANTGLRVSEAVGVRFCDLDLIDDSPQPILRVRTAKRRRTGFDDQVLPGRVALEVGRFAKWRLRFSNVPGSDPGNWIKLRRAVFISRRGGQLSRRAAQRIFKRYAAAAGLSPEHSIHDLRHSFASRMADATGDPFLVRKLLRHSRLESARAYVETSTGRAGKGLAQVEPLTGIRRSGNAPT